MSSKMIAGLVLGRGDLEALEKARRVKVPGQMSLLSGAHLAAAAPKAVVKLSAGEAAKVKNPGSRGGKGYRDDKGEWRYGEKGEAKTVSFDRGDGKLDIAIRDVGPGPGAKRLTGENSGIHTGGAWEWQGKIYKPLDGRPHGGADFHVATQEADVLKAMEGQFLFPKNWTVEEHNGRRFVVRERAQLIPEDISYENLGSKNVQKIIDAIGELNHRGWEIHDHIPLAVDPKGNLFLYDLSNIHKRSGKGINKADDSHYVDDLLQEAAPKLYQLRRNARSVLDNGLGDSDADFERLMLRQDALAEGFIYASFNRPLGFWAKIPGEHDIAHENNASSSRMMPHSWVFTKEPLPQKIMESYELSLAHRGQGSYGKKGEQ